MVTHIAALRGQIKFTKWLIDDKAGYFRKNNNGAMVIHYAAQGGQINFAKWLVDDRKQAISQKMNMGQEQYIMQLKVVRLILPS